MQKNGNLSIDHRSMKGYFQWNAFKNNNRFDLIFRTYELLKSLAGTNNAILSQFGFSIEMLEEENQKREKAKELEVNFERFLSKSILLILENDE